MENTIHHRLLGRRTNKARPRDFYGSRAWVDDLDVVNELGGHTGCVNALSWSRSGRFLASGSDDTHLNIWSYNPENLALPFTLSTSVSTGHQANIFGVKFAPHSNDRTVITCAGDSQVRVFDIEHEGHYGKRSLRGSEMGSTRSHRFQNFFSSARFLNEGNTNARVYKSHGDRVKRIVTESSPYTFLTCSEDGEVRQWDLRQPSSAYPRQRYQGCRNRRVDRDPEPDNVPAPLISYKNYSLDLNSISCAASQPFYIALGGVHVHCFLHDRRMLGRDLAVERGQTPGSSPDVNSSDDHMMDKATRCVKRFAPNDKITMGTHDNGHITACKISEANPNELIASWSGDHIYSFDIVQSPDARDATQEKEATLRQGYQNAQRQRRDRKRKRTKGTSSTNLSEPARTRRSAEEGGEDISLRVRYGNGQSETIPIAEDMPMRDRLPESLLTEAQEVSQRIARSLVQLRRSVFDFEQSVQSSVEGEVFADPTLHTAAFTTVLGQAAALLPQIDDIVRDWSYPMNPSPEDVTLQNTIRRNRQASRRFVQAAGCLAMTLGGRLQTLSPVPDPRLSMFACIEPAQREGSSINRDQKFCYDFLKAILLWLRKDTSALLNGFRRSSEQFKDSPRFPLTEGDDVDAIYTKLVPYLLGLADADKPLLNVDANRFETQQSRTIFESQTSAVRAWAKAFQDLTAFRADENPSSGSSGTKFSPSPLSSRSVIRFWGLKVGRSLLMQAGEGVNYEFVKIAFGGMRISLSEDVPVDRHEELDSDDQSIDAIDVLEETQNPAEPEGGQLTREIAMTIGDYRSPIASSSVRDITTEPIVTDNETLPVHETTGPGHLEEEAGEEAAEEDDEDDDDEGDDDDDDDIAETSSDHQVSDDEDANITRPLFRRTAGFGNSAARSKVETDKPYQSHTRQYKGHCNIKTVKDVNFYGLNDEYIVSGSDSGHLFIWDRKTTQIVNILEADGEIVNVVTGHPYEPMIAASGIDSTIKIFSPDARMQRDARKGRNIATPSDEVTTHSSLRGDRRRRTRAEERMPSLSNDVEPQTQPQPQSDSETELDLPSRNGIPSRKALLNLPEITRQNDLQRRDGVGNAYITRGMLARLAAHIQTQQAAGGGGVAIDDGQCLVM